MKVIFKIDGELVAYYGVRHYGRDDGDGDYRLHYSPAHEIREETVPGDATVVGGIERDHIPQDHIFHDKQLDIEVRDRRLDPTSDEPAAATGQ